MHGNYVLIPESSRDREMKISICGGNGAGKSTVGQLLAERTGFQFLDIEDYYFDKEQEHTDRVDYLYQHKRARDEAALRLFQDIKKYDRVIIAASKLDYSDVIENLLSAVVFLEVSDMDRMRRVRERSYAIFGERILPGGDLYEREEEFFCRVAKKSVMSIRNWYSQLKCPVFVVDGSKRVEETVDWIIKNVVL